MVILPHGKARNNWSLLDLVLKLSIKLIGYGQWQLLWLKALLQEQRLAKSELMTQHSDNAMAQHTASNLAYNECT